MPGGNCVSFAGDRTSLHFAVRPREGRRTVLAYAPFFDYQSRDHVRVGSCARNAGGGTRCCDLRSRGSLVAQYRAYNLRVGSGTQVHRIVSEVCIQEGGVPSSGAGRQALTDPKGRLILSPACGRRMLRLVGFGGLRGWW